MSVQILFFSLLGGILPPLLWLWFWLKEDKKHPEPRRLIIMCFLAGMVVVALALPLQKIILTVLQKFNLEQSLNGFVLLFFWAAAEEYSKYLAAKKSALSKKDFDEPVDALIYLITAALGFAALENVIFLLEVTNNFGFINGFITSNLRFAGATLIHILSSSLVGISIASCFFRKKTCGRNIFLGIFLGSLLHALFNYFIINNEGTNIFLIFLPFWFLIVLLLAAFERVKEFNAQKPKQTLNQS